MQWNPVATAQRVASRAVKAFHGDLPEPPRVSLSDALREAKRADIERNAQRQELADMRAKIVHLSHALQDQTSTDDYYRQNAIIRAAELVEAKQMGGSGPWLSEGARPYADRKELTAKLKEAVPASAIGAYGDIELALQNVEWRREINLSWLEFSRWGIQQIILISRLYYIKHPIIRRLIDIAACYVFGRGVEVSSPDEDANDVLKAFFERNARTLGQIALTNHERAKYTDGNLFFAFFSDTENTGQVDVRTIDATEIQDIVCNPDDSDEPWLYRRVWTARNFDINTGLISTAQMDAWYPALDYDPPSKPERINDIKVLWDVPIHHRRCGAVAKWHFGCPLIYPALDWAREARRFLEACASVMQALSQIALKITTKGGQQALEGIKYQMQTTVGPSTPIWDTNPPAVAGGTFASGPGTTYEAFKTQGAGQDPERVRQYKLMCCMVVGVPESFLSDLSTGNLATATSLDRPTELVFLERQEAWREDLCVIAKYVLRVSAKAINGKLREALTRRAVNPDSLEFREAPRTKQKDGKWVYISEAKRPARSKAAIEVKCTFPSIREGDIPSLVTAVSMAMTLGNKGGQVVGIDEKAGVRILFEYLGYENADELVEEMYPDKTYDPDRTQVVEPPPIPTSPPISPGGKPQVQAGKPQPNPENPAIAPKKSAAVKEATERLLAALGLREAA